jgi:hypothetical protein
MNRTILSIITGASLLVCASGCALSTDREGTAGEETAASEQAIGVPAHIEAELGGVCVETVDVGSDVPILRPCGASNFNQTWQLNRVGIDASGKRIFQIKQFRGVSTALCLGLPLDSQGRADPNAFAELKPCVDGLLLQQWKIGGAGGGTISTRLQNVFTGQCLVASDSLHVIPGRTCASPGVLPQELWDIQ